MAKARQIVSEVQKTKDRKNGRIMIFTGARQVGKTTLVKQYLKDYAYISIEDPVTRISYAQLTAAQWHGLYPKAALDEVQKEPKLIESIKSTYDQYEDVRYALLGSSQLLLLQKVKESLAGRCVLFDMYPLTVPEIRTNGWNDRVIPSIWQMILKDKDNINMIYPSFAIDPYMAQKDKAWQHLVGFGGYPAIVDSDMTDDERYQWLAGYVRTYLERDVRDLASFRDLEPFINLQHALALQTGQTFNASELANELKISSKTVQRYLEYLKISYQTITLQAWARNANKRLTKAPKVHYMDNGVLQAVLRKRGGVTGSEFESMIVSEIYKQAKNIFANVNFYHLRTQDGKEIDLLVETENGYYAFEIKMSKNVIKSDAKHLMNIGDILDKPMIHAFVISNDVMTKNISDNITAVNATMFLG